MDTFLSYAEWTLKMSTLQGLSPMYGAPVHPGRRLTSPTEPISYEAF